MLNIKYGRFNWLNNKRKISKCLKLQTNYGKQANI